MDKHIPIEQWLEYAEQYPENLAHLAVSSGVNEKDWNKMKELFTYLPQIGYICLDVANGYTEFFVDYVKKVRAEYPNKTIIVSTTLFQRRDHLLYEYI